VPEQRPFVERVHAVLCVLYPKDFREAWGAEMKAALRESVRIEEGRVRRAPILLRMVWDTVGSALVLRLSARRQRDPHGMGWGGRVMNSWRTSMRLALRSVVRRPGFAVVAIATMALGIAANSTIFSLVHSVLLTPLPYDQPEELVFVWSDFTAAGIPRGWTSGPQSDALVREGDLFEGFAVLGGAGLYVSGMDGVGQERLYGNRVTANLFDLLGVEAALGRTFLPGEQGEGAPTVTVLTHDLWARQFGANADLVGNDILVNGTPFTVVGVMPEGFLFRMHQSLGTASAPDLWVPMDMDLATMSTDAHMFATLGRLRDGVSSEQGAAQLEAVGRRYGTDVYNTDDFRLYPTAVHYDLVKDVQPALVMLMAAVGMLLLIVAANMATLFLGRALAAERDVAIRTALGAGRGSIMTMLLSEALLIAGLGGVLGLAASAWTLDLFVGLIPDGIPRGEDIAIGLPVIAFTVMITLLVGLGVGILPALRFSHPRLSEVLKEGGTRGGAGTRARRAQRWLVTAQVAVSVVLLAGAGLLGRSLLALFQVDPGFDPAGVVVASVTMPPEGYSEREDILRYSDRLSERISGLPGVEAVGFTTAVPLSAGANQSPMELGSAELPPGPDDVGVESSDWWRVSEGYVSAIGLDVVEGRAFSTQDRGEDVVMIDEVLARQYWPTTSPVGAYINRDSIGQGGERIVGVVSHGRLYDVYQDDRGQVLRPLWSRPARSFSLTVRSGGDATSLVQTLRTVLNEIDTTVPVRFEIMDERVSASLARWRFSLMLMGLFATAALFLAGLGVYGVVAYSVARRTRELGIRIALGAGRSEVSGMVLGQGLRMVGVGLAVGLIASLGLGRLLGALLYGVRPSDPVTIVAVALLLFLTALASTLIPVRRATRISPTEALQAE